MIKRFFQPPERDRWDDYFEPGEVLLWQGAPEPGPHSFIGPLAISIFGLPFLIAGLSTAATGLGYAIGMNNIADLGIGLFLTAFSMPFLAVGIGLTVGTWLFVYHGHKFVRYALTNKRAYVAKSFFKHTLESYSIGPDDAITLEQGKFDKVRFKTIHKKDDDGNNRIEEIGFDNIVNGHDVYALIRQIQREQI
ncbi:MAG: hypothetical protein NWQ23_03660 [Yoonia sp.]|uniref:hypothetical protein n=1 Tax=Yoonia sp. TaxID=2212373 RepID=UPI00273D094C|nr:hypothetical protein [Yoonia sp.]MDP5084493.1 hypothetical protein [Yoonia sp.]